MTDSEAPISITIRSHGTWAIVRVDGEVDLSTASQVEHALEGAGDRLALDLAGVSFMDSTGLRLLIEAGQTHEMVLVAPSEPITKLLDLTKLGDAFRTVASIDEVEG